MNITVYLSAGSGNSEKFRAAAAELGRFIGSGGHTLIYGGSRSGLLGVLADSVLESSGKVIGVEPRMFIDREYQHDSITQLIVTETMPKKKGQNNRAWRRFHSLSRRCRHA